MHRILLGITGVLALLTAVAASGSDATLNPVDKVYYTRVNIWAERPGEISIRNYHVGAMIPVGTKVKIVGFANEKIKFEIEKDNTVCTLVNEPKRTAVDVNGLFERYFSEKDQTAMFGAFRKFTEQEQASITKGEVTAGMSRDAVVMSYGYPPGYTTSSLAGNAWVYSHDKGKKSTTITFRDEKVALVE